MVGGVGIEPTHLQHIRPAPSPTWPPALRGSRHVIASYDRLGDDGRFELWYLIGVRLLVQQVDEVSNAFFRGAHRGPDLDAAGVGNHGRNRHHAVSVCKFAR